MCMRGIWILDTLMLSFMQSIDELEEEMLDGQVLQGPMASREINKLLKAEGKEQEWAGSFMSA